MGNSLLYQIAEPIDPAHMADYASVVDDMLYTLDALGERIGLAAPQVGISKRLVIFRIPGQLHTRYQGLKTEEVPFTVMINPIIMPMSDEIQEDWEVCISVPGLKGRVERYTHICYGFYDLHGVYHEREAQGFHARVVQHEYDHLDGILYPMHIRDMRSFGFEGEMVG